MKKTLLFINRAVLSVVLITFLNLPSKISAQIPDYFANNPEWKMFNASGVNGDCVTEITYVVYLDGDTVIGPYTYKKTRSRGTYHYIDVFPAGCTQTDHFEDNAGGYIRQDSMRIWKYNPFGSDYLLYDFDLQIGDTIPFGGFNNISDTLIIDSISTIMVGTGLRKVFHIPYAGTSSGAATKIIEGIAVVNDYNDGGFFVPFPPCFECEQKFYCYAQNDTGYYGQSPCILNVGISDEYTKLPVLLYPNPIEDQAILSLQDDTDIHISCVNLTGQQFPVSYKSLGDGNWRLEVATLKNGVYILQIEQGSRRSTIQLLKK